MRLIRDFANADSGYLEEDMHFLALKELSSLVITTAALMPVGASSAIMEPAAMADGEGRTFFNHNIFSGLHMAVWQHGTVKTGRAEEAFRPFFSTGVPEYIEYN